jgi:RNA polymerase sigma factor (sigma-70 family)
MLVSCDTAKTVIKISGDTQKGSIKLMQAVEYTKTSLQDCPDGILAQKSLHNDERAFETLVQRYRPLLLNFICSILGDYDLSCDVLQHVFLQLYLSLPTLKKDKPLRSWLFQVARNRCLDELRRKRSVPFSSLEAGEDEEEGSWLASLRDPSPLPEEVLEHHDLQEKLQRAIDGLSPRYRPVVRLRYNGQQSFAEIGRALNIPEATAKTYFQRAKPLLRVALSTDLS